jgi:hypothetical protein
MAIEVQINPKSWKRELVRGIKGASANRKRAFGTLGVGLSAFLLTVFSASPEYSVQMLTAGIQHWELAFITRFSGMYATSGVFGILLTLVFSALVGVTMTNTLVQLKMNKVSLDSLGALPGFIAGGCASCGVGVLSLLGFGGVLASMPFEGNLLRLGGVLLLTVLITKTGNPDVCKI